MDWSLLLYLVVEVASLGFLYGAQKMRGKRERRFLITIMLLLSFLPLCLLVGLRGITVGADTRHYVDAYLRIGDGMDTASYSGWLSIGYIGLCKVVSLVFHSNYVAFNTVVGGLTLLFLYRTVWDSSKNPAFSMFIVFSTCLFYQTFNQSRQMLAIAIICYGLKYIRGNKIIPYILTILLAASIHASAIIMLPFFFIAKMEVRQTTLMRYLIICLICVGLAPYVRSLLAMTSYGSVYAGSEYFMSQTSSVFKLIFGVIVVWMCYIYGKRKINEKEIKYLFNLSMWYLVFQTIATDIYIMNRMSVYFLIMFAFLVPNIYESITSQKQKRMFLREMVLLFMLHHVGYYQAVAAGAGYKNYRPFFLGA